MRFPGFQRLKQKLLAKLIYSPFLRLVLFSFWFRLAFVCFAGLLIFLALFLPRIWRVTPPGFLPVITISGLDMAQAWSLKRSALRATSAGNFELAADAWNTAIANNPANPELVRGALRNVLQIEDPGPKHQRPALGHTVWLLRLTGTNAADVELAAQIYDKFQIYDHALRLLAPLESRLNAREEPIFLKALFHGGFMAQFANRWARAGDRLAADADLQLYHAAYVAGWGPPSGASEGRRRLEAALENSPRRVLANRLRLLVSAHLNDAVGYQESLQRLEQWQSDALVEHVIYWQLLAAAGREGEARALVQSFPRPPVSAAEAIRLLETYVALGLRDEGLQLLQKYTQQFGQTPAIWLLRANLLLEDKKWEELRELALQLRQNPAMREPLAGYSYFIEGRAELGLERPSVAEASFQKAAQHPFEDSVLGFATGSQLLKLGYPAVARDILLPLNKNLAKNPDYWQALFSAAYKIKQSDLMSTAATKAYELQPGNVVLANNYAAALIVNREHGDEAIKLTLQLISRFPDSTAAKINHALALLLNRRNSEAGAILKGIDPKMLSAVETTSLHLGLFETYFNELQYDKAAEVSDLIDVNYLFPNQVKWLEQARRQMPDRSAAK